MEEIDRDKLLKEMGERYYTVRKQKGLTQEQAAEAGGTTQQGISDAERGIYFLSTDVMYRLCIEYGISCDYLLTGNISDKDTCLVDVRAKQLTSNQFTDLKAIIDHFFSALGVPDAE